MSTLHESVVENELVSTIKIEEPGPYTYLSSLTVEDTDEKHDDELNKKLGINLYDKILKAESIQFHVNGHTEENSDCHLDNMVQFPRRSERIKNQAKLNNNMNSEGIKKKSVTSANKRKVVRNINSSLFNCSVRLIRNSSILQESNFPNSAKVPECVLGEHFQDGKKHIIIKWKGGEEESIPEEKCTAEMKELLIFYLENRLRDVQGGLLSVNYPDQRAHTSRQTVSSSNGPETGMSNHVRLFSPFNDQEVYNNMQSDLSDCARSDIQSSPVNSSHGVAEVNLKDQKTSLLQFKNIQKLCVESNKLHVDLGCDDPEIDLKLAV